MKTSRRRAKRPNLTNLMPVISTCSMTYAKSLPQYAEDFGVAMNRHQVNLKATTTSMNTTSVKTTIVKTTKITSGRSSFNVPVKNRPGTEIIPGKLYLTSLAEAKDVSFLKTKRVTAVLTINTEPVNISPEMLKYGGIKTRFINLGDNCTSQISNYFDEIIDFIDENECVLVHCYAGVSRSATAVLAYMMKKYDMKLNDALMFVRSKRHIICPNFSFMGQLKSYENQLNGVEPAKYVIPFHKKINLIGIGAGFDGARFDGAGFDGAGFNDHDKLRYRMANVNCLEAENKPNTKIILENKALSVKNNKIIPSLVFPREHLIDSGIETSESSNESPLGSPKNKLQKIEFEKMQRVLLQKNIQQQNMRIGNKGNNNKNN